MPRTGDTIDAAVEEYAPARWYRFSAGIDGRQVKQCHQALQRLLALDARRPAQSLSPHRPASEVLRDYELALGSGDASRVDELLDELRASSRLSRDNIVHLEVLADARFSRWDAIVDRPGLRDICARRRPRRVTTAIIEAVYERELAQYEDASDPRGALRHFRDNLEPALAGLWTTREGLRGAPVLLTFMLKACVRPGNAQVVEVLLAEAEELGERREYLERIGQLALEVQEVPEDRPAEESALRAFLAGDLERALSLATTGTPQPQVLSMALSWALIIDTQASANLAIAAAERLQTARGDGLELSKVDLQNLEELRRRAGLTPDPDPNEWLEWFQRLETGDWPEATQLLHDRADSWRCPPPGQAAGDWADQMSETIGAPCPQATIAAKRIAVGRLVSTVRASDLSAEFQSLREALFDFLAFDTLPSLEVFDAMSELGYQRVLHGSAVESYEEILDALGTTWEDVQSPHGLWSVLNCLDRFLEAPCPDPLSRAAFARRVVGTFQSMYQRVRTHHWSLLRGLCEEVDCPVPDISEQTADESADGLETLCVSKRIDIYSLRERSARRVKEFLEDQCPSCQVQLHHDTKGGRPALRRAAQSSDCFVLVTGAATHAATGFIEASLPGGVEPCRVHATGMTAILAAIEEHLAHGR